MINAQFPKVSGSEIIVKQGVGVCTNHRMCEEAAMVVTKILIVDDDAGFRQRVKKHLAREPDIEVVGEAADGREALLKTRELEPDLVLMDVRMPGMNGLQATRQLNDEELGLKIIILTMFDLEEYREAAVASGASGYVIKKAMVEELVPAIRDALDSRAQDER